MENLQFVECLFQRIFWNSILLANRKRTTPAPSVEVFLNKNNIYNQKNNIRGMEKEWIFCLQWIKNFPLLEFHAWWVEQALNGIYIRYLDAENNPYSFPYTLAKVRGGLTAYGLALYLTDEIADILEGQQSAFEPVTFEVSKDVKDKISRIPPN